MSMSNGITIQIAADTIERDVMTAAQAIAEAAAMPVQAAHSALWTELVRRRKALSDASVLELDQRTSHWRARLRLYDARRLNDPEADSDMDLDPREPGKSTFAGLTSVAEWLSTTAIAWHSAQGTTVRGLDMDTLKHRLKSLRPTISRRQGNAAWRVPYFAGDQEWLARIDVEKITA